MSVLEKDLDEFGTYYIESCHEATLGLSPQYGLSPHKQACPRLSSPFHGISSPQRVSSPSLLRKCESGPIESQSSFCNSDSKPKPSNPTFNDVQYSTERNHRDTSASSEDTSSPGATISSEPMMSAPRPIKAGEYIKQRGPIRRKSNEKMSLGNPYYRRSSVPSSSSLCLS